MTTLDVHAFAQREEQHHLDVTIRDRLAMIARRSPPVRHRTSQRELLHVVRAQSKRLSDVLQPGISPEIRAFHADRMNLCLAIGAPVVVSPAAPTPSPDFRLTLVNPSYVLADHDLAHFGRGGWAAVTFPAESGCKILLDINTGANPGTLFRCGFGTEDVDPYVGWDANKSDDPNRSDNDIGVGPSRHLFVATEIPFGVFGHAAMIFWPSNDIDWDLFDCTVTTF